jgi:HSP20 family protein
VRYRYLAYKHLKRIQPCASYHGIWESYGQWSSSTAVWRPPTDIYETGENIIVVIELAGIREEELSATMFSDLLVVEGIREQPVFNEMNACHQYGIKYGAFRSEIDLPCAVDYNKVSAEYKNGVLQITIRKQQ